MAQTTVTKDDIILGEQTGVVRTNCMDNLDRTNVVQSLLARRVLLKALGAVDASQPPTPSTLLSSPFHSFEDAFKDLWASNADALSTLYAGTPALKTDVVRLGRRTYKGMLQDGINAVTRYYINNFRDGRRQDSITLWLGRYKPSPHKASPFPPYPTPLFPGGTIFTITYAIQSFPPRRIILQATSLIMDSIINIAAALFDIHYSSPLMQLLMLYLMIVMIGPALLECFVFVGVFESMRRMRRRRFVDRPRLEMIPDAEDGEGCFHQGMPS